MIKKLAKYIKGNWVLTIATPLMVVVECLLEIAIPYVMANLIDEGIYAGNMDAITKYGLLLLGAAFVSLIFGVGAGITAPFASSGFAKNLRRAMFYKVQDYDFQSIDKFSTGSIVTRLTTDVTNVQQAFQMLTRICIRAPGMLVFALVAAFGVNRKLALVFLVVMPVLLGGMIIMASKVQPVFRKVFKNYDKLNNVVQENLHAVRVVKSYNRQEHENGKFKQVSGTIFRDFSKAEKTMAWMMPIMQFSMYTCMILISWFGAKLIVASGNDPVLGLTTGKLMSMISYTTQILISLLMISVVFVMLMMARESAHRIIAILEEESKVVNPAHGITEVKDGSIDFDDVVFRYAPVPPEEDFDRLNFMKKKKENKANKEPEPEEKSERRDVLSHVSIHIKSGDTVGIIGGTGSAKSSLVQLIPRLYDASEGTVSVGGVDVRDYDLTSLRDAVAMVLQKNVLFSGTIAENLRWGKEDATLEEMRHACDVACASEFIDRMEKGFDTYIEQGGANVSGGQKQRLCIARALLKSPKVLILDDSTSAVDMATDASIREAFAHEMPDVTKIIIAQRIASVQDSDMIIVLDNGKVSAAGTHEELLEKSEIYREVFETQNRAGAGAEADFDGNKEGLGGKRGEL